MRLATLILAAALSAMPVFAQASNPSLVGTWGALSGAPGSISFDAKGFATVAPTGSVPMRVRYKQLSKSLLELVPETGATAPVLVIYAYSKGRPDVLEFTYQNGQNQKFSKSVQNPATKK
jgi:hypothetical protein